MISNFIKSEVAPIFLGKIFTAFLTLALIKLSVNLLAKEDYAQLVLLMTFSNFLVQMLIGPFGQGVGRVFLDSKHDGLMSAYLAFWARIYWVFASIIVLSLLLFSYIFVEGDGGIHLFLIALFTIVYGFNDILNGIQNLSLNRWVWAKNTLLDLLLRFLLILLFSSVFGTSLIVICGAYVFSSIMVSIVQVVDCKYISDSSTFFVNKSIWLENIKRISFPAVAWGIGVWLQQSADKWLLQFYLGASSVAEYALIHQVTYMPIMLLFSMLNQYLTPYFYGESSTVFSGLVKRKKMLIFLVSSLVIVIMAVYYLFGELIVITLSSEEYADVARYTPLVVLAAVFYGLADIYIIKLMGSYRVKSVFLLKISYSVLSVAFSFLFIRELELLGAFLAMVISTFIYFSLCYFVKIRSDS